MIARSSRAEKVHFALWFCRRDLFEAVAWPVTVAVICAVALSAAASLMALALPGITAEIRLRRLAESPLARCVWVSIRPQDPRMNFSREGLGELEKAVRGRVSGAGSGITVAGYQMQLQGFFDSRDEPTAQCKGRSIGPSDPLYAGLPRLLRNGPGFDGPEGGGVVLSPTLVQFLGGSPDNPPPFVRVRETNSGWHRDWPVVGVTRDSLPFEYEFLITEAEAGRTRAADSRNPQKLVYSGPLGEDWPADWEGFPEGVRNKAGRGKEYWAFDLRLMSWGDGTGVPTSGSNLLIVGTDNNNLLHMRIYDTGGNRVKDTDETELSTAKAASIATLKQQLPGLLPPRVLTDSEKEQVIREVTSILTETQYWNVEIAVERDLDGRRLRMYSADPRPVETWRAYLAEIQEDLKAKLGVEAAPKFAAVVLPERPSDAPPPPEEKREVEYTHAAIYVTDLDDIRPAADAARGMGLYASDAARALVDEIQASARQAEAVAIALVASFCSAGAIVLILALYLRGRQKSAQFGMLRAIGANDGMLRLIVVTEAAVLWLMGTLGGVLLAAAAGALTCRFYAVTAAELGAAARSNWLYLSIAAYLATSLGSCLIGNLGATSGVRRRPASESLGLIA